ncbi:MAG: hypothetical protein COT71_02055 [Candidatus Andersenbacteria bacterium CG10_big_fil_rev_8_21_14_0_10_54_11]|uniref:Peptidase M23 domain-containing protein n=1 Tax=Candidatus Andersenbacteria bacterium CG10_big_fil_rev_8_21_14_0_10_54_11 TaxID=1974485 RepID=A0A2M6WZI9_9BACT|nr:MAG: hypothetical protein COT71_02055 [Candidatus Andersenbacteria bacterium CG10_big_fil_rev_8_21_14_0_10_54_11]
MRYILPVDRPRQGFTHRQRSFLWPQGHPGVDLLPTIPRDQQPVKAASDGTKIANVGGICQGFDWKDDQGKYHRYCHVQPYKQNGERMQTGEVVGHMVAKGMIFPRGTTHLHWATALDRFFRKLIDPLSLLTEKPLIERVNEALRVRGDDPARSVGTLTLSKWWQNRVARGEIADFEDLKNKIAWHQQNKRYPHDI